jgi:NAD(P)-dependent dehydrogenase (short-subunit alcohol dehydrogenase family)
VLAGKVVVVPLGGVDAVAVARRLASEGAGVVLVAGAGDDEAAGRAAREIEAGTERARVAVFNGDAQDGDALVELITELFG